MLTAFGAHAAGFATARRCLRFLVCLVIICIIVDVNVRVNDNFSMRVPGVGTERIGKPFTYVLLSASSTVL